MAKFSYTPEAECEILKSYFDGRKTSLVKDAVKTINKEHKTAEETDTKKLIDALLAQKETENIRQVAIHLRAELGLTHSSIDTAINAWKNRK